MRRRKGLDSIFKGTAITGAVLATSALTQDTNLTFTTPSLILQIILAPVAPTNIIVQQQALQEETQKDLSHHTSKIDSYIALGALSPL